ncbi:MAG: hypothetical protein Kow0042_14420 [Calditrichia bacterium]
MIIRWDLSRVSPNRRVTRAVVDFIQQSGGMFELPAEGNFPAEYVYTICPQENDERDLPPDNTIHFPLELFYSIEERLECRSAALDKGASERAQLPLLDERLDAFLQTVRANALRKGRPLIRKLPWPEGKPLAVALTHDVDLTRKFGLKFLLGAILRGRISQAKTAFPEIFIRRNGYWTFPDLLQFYRERKYRASFFFLARCLEGWAYRYNISNKKFRFLFNQLLDDGHEIGLHTSKYAFDFPRRIYREKARLEKILGIPVSGVRQHYLRLRYPTAWQYFSDCNFKYDTSNGFNEKVGFLAGTSFPYRTFDSGNDELYSLYEIPFSVMDFSWQRLGTTPEVGIDYFRQLSESIRQTNGLLNIIWHPSNLAEPAFAPYWDYLTTWLEGVTCYQDTLEGIRKWWADRARVEIHRIDYQEGYRQVTLYAPAEMHGLILEVVLPGEIYRGDGNLKITNVSPGVFHVMIKKLNPGDNHIVF